MSHQCYYCEKKAETAHSITIYDDSGVEERLEVLCSPCYEDWLLSQKG